jgi:sigma-B regulation protein RsbU (phosphoserine phosphatase)
MDTLLLEARQNLDLKTPGQLRQALTQVINQCVPDVAIRQRMLLCLSEAVTNLVLHAQDKPDHIRIRFGNNRSSWWLDIFDSSRPWPLNKNPDDNLLFEFQDIENGRGIALMHSQCDELNYHAGNDSQPNQLRLQWSYPKQQKRQTILIVEDNDSLCRLYQAYLDDTFNVITAANGYHALQQLTTQKIDLLLSDIRMPEMNGLSLRKKINQQAAHQLIPFVFLSAEDDQLIQQQATNLGIDDYLVKPVNKIQLLKIIQRILGRSQQIHTQLSERINKNISASLKPQLPASANGWRLQVACRDTGSGGGDLLLHKDFAGKTQLLLSDIMGHDDSAKFFSHACGGYIHGLLQSMQINSNPALLLEQISNYAMVDKLLSHVTLTCCSIQLSEQGKITLASAGHPAPLLLSANKIETVAVGGVLPGLIADYPYQSRELNLQCGQRLAFYTDGLFESAADNSARLDLQTRISEALLATLDLPIDQSLQQVMNLFDQITNAQPSDDALLLLLEPLPFS